MTTIIKNVQSTTTIQSVQGTTMIKIDGAMPVTAAQIAAYFAGVPEHESDTAALADSVTIYRASNEDFANGAHESAAPGTLIIIQQ